MILNFCLKGMSNMPAPKDPEKYEAYREKMRQIALERGYGKWMEGRKHTPETIEKMQRQQREMGNDPEERQRRSERAKASGVGKWMIGRSPNSGFIEHVRSRKGKTYEEIYGEERAQQEKESRKLGNQQAKAGKRPPHLMKLQEEIAEKRRGKTYKEIYGEGVAKEEADKRKAAQRKRWEEIPKKADQRPKHNGDYHYVEWRKTVFERDDYTCQHCQQRGGALQAHHIRSWSKYPDLRYEVENGVTLCIACHKIANHEQRLAEKQSENDGASENQLQ
jgi:5-methylcytosine-specific restriction endonuclease McrA